jgi:hypothetical protein
MIGVNAWLRPGTPDGPASAKGTVGAGMCLAEGFENRGQSALFTRLGGNGYSLWLKRAL